MATSQKMQIPKITKLIKAIGPVSILDIGAGFGTYGFLAREILDERFLMTNREEKYLHLEAVEVFEKYLNPIHKFIYDKVYIGDIVKIQHEIKSDFDLILMIDVLEHIEKTKGQELLKNLLDKNKSVLVSTPIYVGEQEAHDNKYEKHISAWNRSFFKQLGHTIFISDTLSIIVLISKNQALIRQVKKKLRREKIKDLVRSIKPLHMIYRKFFWKGRLKRE